MKSCSRFISSAVVFSLCFAPVVALAAPVGVTVELRCPMTKGNVNQLSNFGHFIAGYGERFIQDKPTADVYFQSENVGNDVPSQLANYSAQGTRYDSTSGKVTCNYKSTALDEAPFEVAYTLTNGRGGQIVTQKSDAIKVSIPFGLAR